MKNILLIEDSKEAQALVRIGLTPEYAIETVETTEAARKRLKANPNWDLVLLDVTLPDGNGFDFCRELDTSNVTKSIPVIMLTAKSGVEDKVVGLASGADDYLPKPFDSRELKARVESVIRRRRLADESKMIQIGKLQIHLPERKVTDLNGKSLPDVTPIEFKILTKLAQAKGQSVSREALHEFVWGKDVHLSLRNIDTHVCKLRQKIESTGVKIKSSRGEGYGIAVEAEPAKELSSKKANEALTLPSGAI